MATYSAQWSASAPPYSGPPPIPSGYRVNANQWQTGQWQKNPQYNQSQAPSQAPAWAPSKQWIPFAPQGQVHHGQYPQATQQQQQQQQQSFNPYKKIPQPPSAEYMASRLSDNPLGLTGMVPRKELYGDDNAVTPWLWEPRGLDEDDSSDDDTDTEIQPTMSPTRDLRRDHSHPTFPTQERSQSRHSRDQSHSSSAGNQYRTNTLTRHSSEPPPDRPTYGSSQRVSSASAAASSHRTPTRSGSGSYSQHQNGTTSYQQEAYTSNTPLKPTFSTAIIRTPEYYSNSPSRTSSATGHRNIIASRNSESSRTLTHFPVSAEPSPTRSILGSGNNHSFTEEPSEMLSPLMISSETPKHSSRDLSRHHQSAHPSDRPAALGSIPEFSSPKDGRVRRSSSRSRKHSSTTPTYDIYQPSSAAHSRPSSRHASPTTTSFQSTRHQITPPSNYSTSTNPLPRPPEESKYVTSSASRNAHTSSSSASRHAAASTSSASRQASTSASKQASSLSRSNSQPRRSPQSSTGKYRRGYWNRRGDHLIDGYVVYAPAEKAYPAELRDYPGSREGYRDDEGNFCPFSTAHKELPDSLPRHGKLPKKPYEYFLKYRDA